MSRPRRDGDDPPAGSTARSGRAPSSVASVPHRSPARPAASRREDRVTAASDANPDTSPVQVVCETAGMVLLVPAGTSILEAVRDAGLAVAPPCADGLCGTCETRVLDGEPDHRDAILTADERAFGETMLICVSRARTPRLVLDL
jgi:ferredoxin